MKRIPEPIVYALWGAAATAFAWSGSHAGVIACIAGAAIYAAAQLRA